MRLHYAHVILLGVATAVRLQPSPATIPALSRSLSPVDVVQAQLVALSQEDLEASFQFASPANRRSRGTHYDQFLSDPEYSVLIAHSQHQIRSALALGPDRYSCRVSLRPSEAALRCLSATATVDVGQRVRICSDERHVKRCFDSIQYQYSGLMDAMCGEEFEVVCHARENYGTNIIGLPSPDGTQDGVWYFPVTLLEHQAEDEREPADGEVGGQDAEEEEGEEELAFRWELSRQPDHPIAFELGDVMVHARYGYRGAIVGFDGVCVQTEEWIQAMGVDDLPAGRDQPFYHVLVDERDRPGDQVTYVAQENIVRTSPEGEFPCQPLRHRLLASLLQPGSFDKERGGYEPLPQLRQIYPPNVDGCWMVDAVVADKQ